MERHNTPPVKKKIKKEPTPLSSDSNLKKGTAARETEETNGPLSSKDYACVSPETISIIAESIGIPNIGDEVAANLAEDVSYKLQEIINASCTIMRRSKRRKLLTSDVNSAFLISDVHHIFGHSRKDSFKFLRLPDGELFIPEDHEVDLVQAASSTDVPKMKKASYVATSYPILRSMQLHSQNGHTLKTEGKSLIAFPNSKSVVVNGDSTLEAGTSLSANLSDSMLNFTSKTPVSKVGKLNASDKKRTFTISNGPHPKPGLEGHMKLNGRVKFASHGIKERLRRETEDELRFSEAQLSYFNVVANCIIEGHEQIFKQALCSIRTSRKVNVISAPLLNFIALSVCHIPRHFGLAMRLLDTIDALLCNANVSPNFSIAVNRTVNALLAMTSDQNTLEGRNDFFLRRKAAQLLTRVLLVWGIEEQHVSELLSRVARVLGDPKEKIQSHFGALVIFQSLGKAALGWLSPILKCFLPLLEKMFPLPFTTSTVQLEEIRGILLDIVDLLSCDATSPRFKIKASTIQETQAMIQLDSLLYNYCGDAVCARRRPSLFKFRQSKKKRGHIEKLLRTRVDSRSRQQMSNRLNLHYISPYPQKVTKSNENPVIFEDACFECTAKKKDIHFKFAGANPTPKDSLRKKVLDKTHVQFVPSNSSQMHLNIPRQSLIVGRIHRSRCKSTNKRINVPYSLSSVI